MSLMVLAACSKPVEEAQGPELDSLTILYTCDTRGHIEPCGCSSGQAGGISRRMTFLHEQEAGPTLLVDAGNVTAGPRDWEVFEMEYILKGYDAMGYHAVNVGHREVSLGAERLAEVAAAHDYVVSANLLTESGDSVFPPYRVVTLPEGQRVGIIGVMGDQIDPADLGDGLRVAPPIEAIAKVLPDVVAQAPFVVVLAFANEDTMRAIAERFYEIDVIVGGDVTQPTRTPVKVNRALMVSMTDKGKAIGKLALTFDESGAPVAENDITMLMDTMLEAPEAVAIVDEFKVELAKQDFKPHHRDDEEGLSAITAPRSASANHFVSAQDCASCHPKAVETWEHSKHSHALDSLAAKGHDFNPRCLQCHTVGYGATDGYVNRETTPLLGAVSCGNCHGRGEYHARFHRGEDVPERAAKLTSLSCVTCHDPENSPGFNFETYWEQIRHGKE